MIQIKRPLLAFTLIELLAVVAIIGILSALLLPAIGKIQDSANGTKCASNLKQIGSAMMMYAGENNGIFPESGGTIVYTGTDVAQSSGGSGMPPWTKQLEKYLGTYMTTTSTDVRVFTCPSVNKLFGNQTSGNINKNFNYFNGSHAALYPGATKTGYAPLRQALIQYPSKHILCGDVACNIFAPGTGGEDADKDDYTQNPAFCDPGSIAKLHGGKVNILFADGHVAPFASFDTGAMTVWYNQVADYSASPLQ